MNPQETQQVAACNEKWVPSVERVKISSTNIRLETTVPQKEDTFQVIINIIKNSTCFKAFTISIDVLEIFMQTILDICPRVEGVDFVDVPDNDIALTFLIDLGYKGLLNRHTNMLKFVRIGEDYQEYRLHIPDVMLTEAIKQSESYHMFIKYSTCLIPPKKSRGKGSKGKKAGDESQETVDVSEESELEPEPAKKKTASRRVVKKKVTLSAADNIISDDPDAALELGKSISKTKVEEAEAARQVYDTLTAPKSKPSSSKTKLKGDSSLTLAEQEGTNIMQALKESKKTSRRQPDTRGSNEGTGSKQGVPDEFRGFREDKDIIEENVISLSGGDEQDSEHSDDDNDDAEKDEKDDVKTESDEDDIYKYKICVRKDEDEEIKDAEVKGSDKGFVDQFLKLSSDSSLVSTIKDSADADLSSLLDIPIQHETHQIESPSVHKIPVSMILETTNLPPIPEIVTETPVTTADPSPQVKPIISTVQQTTMPIPTPTITNDAPTIIIAVPESNAL
ncbi:hypothetical protein Tco_1259600, partial [Tanacetum coccineum]